MVNALLSFDFWHLETLTSLIMWAMNKIPWLIDCKKGDLILPDLLGIMMGPIGLGNRFQPTS